LMDYQTVVEYCLQKPGAWEGYPFGEGALVIKVQQKMFALIAEGTTPLRISLKCDPDDALMLRAQYLAIIPGYHLNKRHWNTLNLDGSIPPELVFELIDHSYDLVKKSLPKERK
jgi:predicted DNA-binding protein (MmcQ/YjbR family)